MPKYKTIIIVICAALSALITNYLMTPKVSTKELSTLEILVNELNSKLPIRLDQNTTWISSVALEPKTLVYYYRVNGIDINSDNSGDFIGHLKPILTNTYKTSPEMAELRAMKTNLKYVYQSEDGSHLFDFMVNHSDLN